MASDDIEMLEEAEDNKWINWYEEGNRWVRLATD